MIRYAISHRGQFAGSDAHRLDQVVQQAVVLAREGVDYFQLREKDLAADALLGLTLRVRDAVATAGGALRVVLNGPRALASQAGVGWHCSGRGEHGAAGGAPCVSCSVHTAAEAEQYRHAAALLLFAPVFEKAVAGQTVQPGTGLQQLRAAVQRAAGTPVLALGGITAANESLCLAAGAAGVAGIRLFYRNVAV